MKRDPVHFFDERGASVLSYDHLVKENQALRERVSKLEAALKASRLRLKALTGETETQMK